MKFNIVSFRPFVREAVVIAGPLQVGRQDVGGRRVDKRGAVLSRDGVVGKPARPIEQRDGDAPGVGIIARGRTAAAVDVSRREFVEVAAQLAEFVVIDQIEHERF